MWAVFVGGAEYETRRCHGDPIDWQSTDYREIKGEQVGRGGLFSVVVFLRNRLGQTTVLWTACVFVWALVSWRTVQCNLTLADHRSQSQSSMASQCPTTRFQNTYSRIRTHGERK